MKQTIESQFEAADPLLQRVQKIENQLFPGIAKSEGYTIAITPENRRYMYFKPSYFFSTKFIEESDVESLKESGRKLLSIGSGPAYLERVLEKLGVPKENITLSDISGRDVPKDFRSYTFDMHAEHWPQFEEGLFDLIIIPEAFSVSFPSPDPRSWYAWDVASRLNEVIQKSLQNLKPEGELRIIDPAFAARRPGDNEQNDVVAVLKRWFLPMFPARVIQKENSILVVKKEVPLREDEVRQDIS